MAVFMTLLTRASASEQFPLNIRYTCYMNHAALYNNYFYGAQKHDCVTIYTEVVM